MFGSKIKLDKDLLERCKEYAQETGYSSVEEFITHALERELRSRRKIDVGEEREVVKQLKGLGYID
jgi:metal-responsive CopG/Arc/MetJ family transcriptional regulator